MADTPSPSAPATDATAAGTPAPDAEAAPTGAPEAAAPIRGFIDMHNHQFANLGFGGLAFWGSPMGDLAHAVPPCTPAHGFNGSGDILGNLLGTIAYDNPAVTHDVDGNPSFVGWPDWTSITHQQMHVDWLHRAVNGGLRLMVMFAVNSEYLAGKARRAPGRSIYDMEAVDLQLAGAQQLQAAVDKQAGGPGKGWYRIVHSPQEARTVMQQGKLAVVLGIEVDFLFSCHQDTDLDNDKLRTAIDHYFALGVRHIFPIHFSNNGFGGTAFQNGLSNDLAHPLDLANATAVYPIHTDDGTHLGYRYRGGRMNVDGLTDRGKVLINELMNRGMLVDVDHMSWRSRNDALDIAESRHYPVMSSHVGFVDIAGEEKRHEGNMTTDEVTRIVRLGGMISPITHQGELADLPTFHSPHGGTTVTHTCGNTSETWVQAYLAAIAYTGGKPVGLGTDMNGFAGSPGPRFGPRACPGSPPPIPGGPHAPSHHPKLVYPFVARASGNSMAKSKIGNRTYDFNNDGLAHVGMLPDLIADAESLGLTHADLEPLMNSAEGYLQAWEKCWALGFEQFYWAKIVSFGAKRTALEGQKFQVSAEVTNLGGKTWLPNGDVTLRATGATGADFWQMAPSHPAKPVAYGEGTAFHVMATAPASTGVFGLSVQMFHGDQPFGHSDGTLQVTVSADPCSQLHDTYTADDHLRAAAQQELDALDDSDPTQHQRMVLLQQKIDHLVAQMTTVHAQATTAGCPWAGPVTVPTA